MKEMSSTGEAYFSLADWFEYLNDDCGYEEWSQYLVKKLSSLVKNGAKGLDIGCGSGYFTRVLKKAGYDVTGVDISQSMLMKAEKLSSAERLKIQYILGDITSFKSIEKADFAVAVNDCINYVKKDKIKKAFSGVYSSLKKGGYFLFDISSENKLKNKVAGTVSADDRDKITYLSFNTLEGESVNMDVTLFIKQKNGDFKRFDERHTLYIYSVEEIEREIERAGFCLVGISGHLGEDADCSDRIEFFCKKN